MRQGLSTTGDVGYGTVVLVALFNSALHLFMLYAAFWIFNVFFHTPWSRT